MRTTTNNDLATHLDVLEILTEALTIPRTLDEGLEQITRMTCQLMNTTQAAFLLIDEEQHAFIVRSAVGLDSPNIRPGHPLVVPERLLNILWRLQNIHEINWIYSGIEEIVFPIIAMPIHFKGKRVGHLLTGGARDAASTRAPLRRKMFALLEPFASLVIENAKATDLLSQRFAMNSRELLAEASRNAADGAAAADQLMLTSLQNPNKVVRLLAESFYKELVKAGFTHEHLATAGIQLLDCLARDIAAENEKNNAN